MFLPDSQKDLRTKKDPLPEEQFLSAMLVIPGNSQTPGNLKSLKFVFCVSAKAVYTAQ